MECRHSHRLYGTMTALFFIVWNELLFAESSMNDLQSVSVVVAFPIGAVIAMIAVSFMKDAKKYMESLDESAKEKGEK